MIINKLADKEDLLYVPLMMLYDDMRHFVKHVHNITGIEPKYLIHEGNYYDILNSPKGWIRFWEYCRSIYISNPKIGQRVLDVGGGSSIFCFYLRIRGLDVYTIDIRKGTIDFHRNISNKLNIQMESSINDISETEFQSEYFDHVYCMCVWEHIDRRKQAQALLEMKRILKPGGILSLTFDYGKDACDNPIINKVEIKTRLIDILDMKVIGNEEFYTETNLPYQNIDYTFGCLYLWKEIDNVS